MKSDTYGETSMNIRDTDSLLAGVMADVQRRRQAEDEFYASLVESRQELRNLGGTTDRRGEPR